MAKTLKPTHHKPAPKLLRAAIQNNRMDLAAHVIVLSLVEKTIEEQKAEKDAKAKARRTARQ